MYGEELRLQDIERIAIQSGWIDLVSGYFCQISKDGICVEDFAKTKRAALRLARRAWREESLLRVDRYPRVETCD